MSVHRLAVSILVLLATAALAGYYFASSGQGVEAKPSDSPGKQLASKLAPTSEKDWLAKPVSEQNLPEREDAVSSEEEPVPTGSLRVVRAGTEVLLDEFWVARGSQVIKVWELHADNKRVDSREPLVVGASGYLAVEHPGLEPGQQRTVALQPALECVVQAIGIDGGALPDAKVQLVAVGAFELVDPISLGVVGAAGLLASLAPGDTIEVSSGPRIARATVPAWGGLLRVQLPVGARVVRFVDADGRGIRGKRVRMHLVPSTRERSWEAITDAEGRAGYAPERERLRVLLPAGLRAQSATCCGVGLSDLLHYSSPWNQQVWEVGPCVHPSGVRGQVLELALVPDVEIGAFVRVGDASTEEVRQPGFAWASFERIEGESEGAAFGEPLGKPQRVSLSGQYTFVAPSEGAIAYSHEALRLRLHAPGFEDVLLELRGGVERHAVQFSVSEVHHWLLACTGRSALSAVVEVRDGTGRILDAVSLGAGGPLRVGLPTDFDASTAQVSLEGSDGSVGPVEYSVSHDVASGAGGEFRLATGTAEVLADGLWDESIELFVVRDDFLGFHLPGVAGARVGLPTGNYSIVPGPLVERFRMQPGFGTAMESVATPSFPRFSIASGGTTSIDLNEGALPMQEFCVELNGLASSDVVLLQGNRQVPSTGKSTARFEQRCVIQASGCARGLGALEYSWSCIARPLEGLGSPGAYLVLAVGKDGAEMRPEHAQLEVVIAQAPNLDRATLYLGMERLGDLPLRPGEDRVTLPALPPGSYSLFVKPIDGEKARQDFVLTAGNTSRIEFL